MKRGRLGRDDDGWADVATTCTTAQVHWERGQQWHAPAGYDGAGQGGGIKQG